MAPRLHNFQYPTGLHYRFLFLSCFFEHGRFTLKVPTKVAFMERLLRILSNLHNADPIDHSAFDPRLQSRAIERNPLELMGAMLWPLRRWYIASQLPANPPLICDQPQIAFQKGSKGFRIREEAPTLLKKLINIYLTGEPPAKQHHGPLHHQPGTGRNRSPWGQDYRWHWPIARHAGGQSDWQVRCFPEVFFQFFPSVKQTTHNIEYKII